MMTSPPRSPGLDPRSGIDDDDQLAFIVLSMHLVHSCINTHRRTWWLLLLNHLNQSQHLNEAIGHGSWNSRHQPLRRDRPSSLTRYSDDVDSATIILLHTLQSEHGDDAQHGSIHAKLNIGTYNSVVHFVLINTTIPYAITSDLLVSAIPVQYNTAPYRT